MFDAFKFSMTMDSKSYQQSMKKAVAATQRMTKTTKGLDTQIVRIDKTMTKLSQSLTRTQQILNRTVNSSSRAVSSFNQMANTYVRDINNITRNLRNLGVTTTTAFNGMNAALRSTSNAVASMTSSLANLNSQLSLTTTDTQQAATSTTKFSLSSTKATKINKEFGRSLYSTRRANSQYVLGLSQAQDATDLLSASISKVVRIVRTVFYFEIASKYVKKLTSSFIEQESALARLNKLMKNVHGTTQEDVQAIVDYSKQLAKSTTFAKDAIEVGASQLSTFFLQRKSIEQLLPAYTDLLAGIYGVNVSQKEAIHGANLLGKAFAGLPGMLRRWGVMLSKEQAELIKTGTESQRVAVLVDVLKMNFGGLAEAMADTREGQIAKMKVDLRELGKILGAVLMPIMDKGVALLSKWSGKLVSLFSEPTKILDKISTKIVNYYTTLSKGAKAVMLFGSAFLILKLAASTINSLTAVTLSFFKIFTGGGNPILMFLIGFYATFTAIRAVMETLGVDTSKWSDSLREAVESGKELGTKVIKWTFIKAGEMWDWLTDVWVKIKPDVLDLINNVMDAGKKTAEWSITASGNAWDWFQKNKIDIIKGFLDALNWFLNTGKQTISIVMEASGNLWEAGKTVWNNMIEFLKGIIGINEESSINLSLNLTDEDKFKALFIGIMSGLAVKKLGGSWGMSIAVGFTLAMVSLNAAKVREQAKAYAEELQSEVVTNIAQGKVEAPGIISELKQKIVLIAEKPQSLFTDMELITAKLELSLLQGFSNAFIGAGKLLDKFIVTPIEKFIDSLLDLPNTLKDAWNNFWQGSNTKMDDKKPSDFMLRMILGSDEIVIPEDSRGFVPRFADGRVREDGIVSGKGTGKSDSILARISNGEAIINAQSTQRYLPLIRAINENKLPGFATGFTSGTNAENSTVIYGMNDNVQDVNIMGVQGNGKTFFENTWNNAIKLVQRDFAGTTDFLKKAANMTGLDKQLEKMEELIKGMDKAKEMEEWTSQINKGFDELMNVSSETLDAIRQQAIQSLNNMKGQYSLLSSIDKTLGADWTSKLVDAIGGFKTFTEDIFSETDPTKVVGTKQTTIKIKDNPVEQVQNTLMNRYDNKDIKDEEGNVQKGQGIDIEGLLSDSLAGITEAFSTTLSNLIGELTEMMASVFSLGESLPIVGGAFEALAGITALFGSTLLSAIAPLMILAPIFQGMMSVLQPLLDKVLTPIMKLLTTIGEVLGGLIATILMPLMFVLTPVIAIINVITYGLDQFVLWINNLPFIGGFLTADQIKEKRRSIDDRMKDYATPGGSTDKTIEGEQFKAGGTRQTTNNINVTFKENIMLTDDKPAIKKFADLFIDYMRENVDKDFAM